MMGHQLTITFRNGIETSMACREPESAPCHIRWETICGCDSPQPEHLGDLPFHHDSAGHKHYGTYDPDYCRMVEEWDRRDLSMLDGAITVPVECQDTDRGPLFRVAADSQNGWGW